MITNEQIKQIVADCKKNGNNVGLRDISYVLLTNFLEDRGLAYRAIFGSDKDYTPEYADTYDQTSAINYLRTYIEINLNEVKEVKKKESSDNEISFEENKTEMVKLINKTREARKKGEIKVSDALKIESDLRVKLNDKFNVEESEVEQMVVVNQKFNAICPSCGREIYVPTKEDMMKKYNLIEKDTIE